ncbi:MAG TPA: IS21-like element helper ATPase IstB [Anaerolineaceae bacterium]|nr:IS21-like element helper ATPase IstB [Anaerolineaceae bacterium]
MSITSLFERLTILRLPAFRAGLEEQLRNPQYAGLSFEDRLSILLDLEITRRRNNTLQRRIKIAHFPFSVSLEDIDFSASRGLDRRFFLELAQCDWISNHLNLFILGPTGVGKSFISAAMGFSACCLEFSVRYFRTARLLTALAEGRSDPQQTLVSDLARTDLLILDDWLRDPPSLDQAKDLLEILDDRFGHSSTLVVSQLPVPDWYPSFPNPTVADAILDRLVHNAHRLNLEGESQRKLRSPLRMSST